MKSIEEYPSNFVNAMVALVIELTFLAVVFGVAFVGSTIVFVVIAFSLAPIIGKAALGIGYLVSMVVFLAAMMAGYAGGQKLKLEVKRGAMMSKEVKE
jgi:hypothetical protein